MALELSWFNSGLGIMWTETRDLTETEVPKALLRMRENYWKKMGATIQDPCGEEESPEKELELVTESDTDNNNSE